MANTVWRMKRCRSCGENDVTVRFGQCATCVIDGTAERMDQEKESSLTTTIGDLVRFSPAALRAMGRA